MLFGSVSTAGSLRLSTPPVVTVATAGPPPRVSTGAPAAGRRCRGSNCSGHQKGQSGRDDELFHEFLLRKIRNQNDFHLLKGPHAGSRTSPAAMKGAA
jgi:hypothetical protein